MKRLLLAVILTGAAARADEGPPPTPPPEPPPYLAAQSGQSWSVVGARTVGHSAKLIEGGVGWPGVHVSFLTGATEKLDVGARFTFNYGVEGLVQGPVIPGIKLQGLLHVGLLNDQKISLAFHFEPGPLFYFFPNGGNCTFDRFGNLICTSGTSVGTGLALPVSMKLGIAASSALNVGVSFELAMWLSFRGSAQFNVPILVGAGAEYFIQSNLLLYFLAKMGPTLTTAGGSAVFTFYGLVGIGYRF